MGKASRRKKDTGVVTLKNNVKISEETRDRLAKIVDKDGHPLHTPDKAAFSPDNATTKELEDHQFSGFRVNAFTNDVELWCVGSIMIRRNLDLIRGRPQTLMDMHEEAFLTTGSVMTMPISEGVKAITQEQRKDIYGGNADRPYVNGKDKV